jgi:hypothetical protein
MYAIAAAALCLWASSASTDSPPVTKLEGLTAALQADPVTVPMGDAVHFVVTLALDTTTAASDSLILNQFSSRCEFVFVNKQTEKSFVRSPYDSGMPHALEPGNLVHLKHGDRIRLEDWTVHLLSEKGEQIPPGEYSVTAAYENDGGVKMEAYLDSTRHFRQRVYEGAGTVWTGKIQSKPCIVTILPASEEKVEVAVPKTLVVDDSRIPGQIGWTYRETSKIRVEKRPGFALGNRWHLETRVDGATISEYPRGEGLDPSGMSFLPPDISARVKAGKNAELILHMEVFETSVQPGHMWMPEQGDFKVLWHGQTGYKFMGKGK